MLPLVYHPEYAPAGIAHFARLRVVAEIAQAQALGQFNLPRPLPAAALRGLHDDVYLDAVFNGAMPLANSSYLPWSEALVSACLHMLGGQLLGAQLALEHGRCINLACGFHHAHPHAGGGFCVFNGLALVAHALPTLKVAVLDCDEHGGDGTEAFANRLSNLHTFSVFGSRFGVRGGLRSRALHVPTAGTLEVNRVYLEVLDQALDEVLALAPDLVVYQAGMDSHEQDPRASLKVNTATLARRDQVVFATFKQAQIPVLAVLAGAYQGPQQVSELYRNLLLAANA
jgi:acetoin utilization deacetylase AcuC-like enzyme